LLHYCCCACIIVLSKFPHLGLLNFHKVKYPLILQLLFETAASLPLKASAATTIRDNSTSLNVLSNIIATWANLKHKSFLVEVLFYEGFPVTADQRGPTKLIRSWQSLDIGFPGQDVGVPTLEDRSILYFFVGRSSLS